MVGQEEIENEIIETQELLVQTSALLEHLMDAAGSLDEDGSPQYVGEHQLAPVEQVMRLKRRSDLLAEIEESIEHGGGIRDVERILMRV